MAALTGTSVLFSDTFDEKQLSDKKWKINKHWGGDGGDPAFLGKTFIRQWLPYSDNHTARIQLDTWNRGDGTTFLGSEAVTKDAWDAKSTKGVAFQANMKFEGTQGGMLAGLFFYEVFPLPPDKAPRSPHDELDFEILTSQLVPANKSVNKISTNVFNHTTHPNWNGEIVDDYPNSLPPKQLPGFTPNTWHTYRIEWLPARVRWLIDGQEVRVESVNLPQADRKEALHINLWGVPDNWGPSDGDRPPRSPLPIGPPLGDKTLQPAKSAAQNKTFMFDVQAVKVETISTRLGSEAAESLDGGGDNDGIDGGDGDDTLNGMAGDDSIWGGAGNDTILGGDGSDTIDGESGNDYLYGQGGDDTLIGGAAEPGGANQLWGGAGNDTASYVGTTGIVYADLGAKAGYVDGVLTDQMNSIENLTGGSGTNTLVGDDGANVLTGGDSNDYLYGQGGDDTLIGGAAPPGGANQLWGGAGNDTASLAGASGTVYADLAAQAGYVDGVLVDQMNSIENLVGGPNADTVVGDSGANVLAGGDGGDALWGHGGTDTFVYTGYSNSNLVSGYDTIGDFVSGTSKIDLTALLTDPVHVVIESDGTSTSLYVAQNSGVFDETTDLAISFVGASAITMADIYF